MSPPFTIEAFLAVFAAYNAAIWPFQIVAYGFAMVAFSAIFFPQKHLRQFAFAALAVLWAFTGIGYHYLFFTTINPLAPVFAAFFVLQAVLFSASAIRPGDLTLQIGRDFRTAAGLITIIYALLIYPISGIWAGHGLMMGPMFGVAPCPTTIFTIGILLLARGRWVVWLSIIPFLWSLIGLAAAVQLGIPEDLAMPVAGAILAAVLVAQTWRNRHSEIDMASHRL